MNLIEKYKEKKIIYGDEYAIYALLQYFRSKIGIRDAITKRKLILSRRIDSVFQSTVAYGVFKGLKLSRKSWWGATDKAAMLLGLYEKEILESLVTKPVTHNIFIDLGAADGYYGVGVLVAKLFDYSYCFEITELGQKTILENARNNNVTDKIVVNGIANSDFYKKIPPDHLSRCVLLVDIEGAEFDVFDEQTFSALKHATIIVELHDWQIADGDKKLQKFIKMAEMFFSIKMLTTSSRDTSCFSELKSFSDDDRWLICSEGRGRRMSWLRLDPKTV